VAKLVLRLKQNTGESIEKQIVRQIGESITQGKLKVGASLPSTHALGAQLGISRETVRRAYVALRESKQIVREGYADYQVRGGTAKRPASKASPVKKSAPTKKAARRT
jgi:DNA-binding transcriptional regulator YhcF (GntR family)